MTDKVAEHILRLLDEIREAIALDVESGKERSPSPSQPDKEERRHVARRATDPRPLQTTIEAVADTTSRLLNDAASDGTAQPPGKTFRRVRVTVTTDSNKEPEQE